MELCATNKSRRYVLISQHSTQTLSLHVVFHLFFAISAWLIMRTSARDICRYTDNKHPIVWKFGVFLGRLPMYACSHVHVSLIILVIEEHFTRASSSNISNTHPLISGWLTSVRFTLCTWLGEWRYMAVSGNAVGLGKLFLARGDFLSANPATHKMCAQNS